MAEQRFQPGDEPIPGFMLRKFLGKGNFGEVWEARAAGDVKVAVKILSDIDRKSGRKAFKALQLVKNLNYPHLVTVVGFWLKDEQGNLLDDVVDVKFSEDSTSSGIAPAGGLDASDVGETMRAEDFIVPDTVRDTPNTADRPAQLFIAMGLADETLDQCMARHQEQRAARGRKGKENQELNGIPRIELLRYLEGAAKGLDFLNIEHSIQHGDVKPANIMIISGEGQMSDFDLAQALINLRATESTIGTLAYMAPEVFDKGVPTPTSDQYALAITYYEMRTGKLPYSKEIGSVVIHEKVAGRLDLSLLPKAERKVIRRAASIHPAARYPSCVEMVKELRKEAFDVWKFLRRVAAVTLLLTCVLGAWQFAVEEPYRLSDVWDSVFSPNHEPTVALEETKKFQRIFDVCKRMETVEADPSRVISPQQLKEIRDAISDIADLADAYAADECGPLVDPNSQLVGLLCARATQTIQTDVELAETHLSDLLKHIEKTEYFDDDNSDSRDMWRDATTLAICRTRMADNGEVNSFKQELASLPDLRAGSWLHHPQQTGLYALHGLIASRSSSDVLAKEILEPVAMLVEADAELKELTIWENGQVSQLITAISTKMRPDGSR